MHALNMKNVEEILGAKRLRTHFIYNHKILDKLDCK